jgi:polar amino acid transport system substrate-binding protein
MMTSRLPGTRSASARPGLIAALLVLALSGCTSRISSGEFAEVPENKPKVETPPVAAPSAAKCTDAERKAIADVASFPPNPDAASVANIKAKGRLVAGVSADTLLFGFRNPLSGRLEGLDVDLIREVAKKIFGVDDAQVDAKIEFRVIPYSARLPLLESGAIDIVAHTMTINCDRWKRINFSTQYYSAGQRLLVRGDSNATELANLPKDTRVCVPEKSTSEETVDANAVLKANKVSRSDITECLVAMQQGDADATLSDDAVLAGFVQQDPYLKIVGPAITQEPYGIGVSKKNVGFAQFVNSVLEDLRTNGGLKALFEKHKLTTAEVPAADTSRPLP